MVFKLSNKNHFEALLIFIAAAFVTTTALANDPIIVFETTLGEMTAELYPNQAPKTVENEGKPGKTQRIFHHSQPIRPPGPYTDSSMILRQEASGVYLAPVTPW